MFESRSRLQDEVQGLVDAVRTLGEGRYAALFDRKGLLLETPAGGEEGEWALRGFVQKHAEALFRIPAALHDPAQPMDDTFADWTEDEFFLAFVNGRVGLLVACPDAKRLEDDSGELLRALVDRLLRLNPGWRTDEKGRGVFFGRPRLDTVAIGRPEQAAS
jgi:hypothetical protein